MKFNTKKKQVFINLIKLCIPKKFDELIPFFDRADLIEKDLFEVINGLIDYTNTTTSIFLMEFDKKTKPSTFQRNIEYSLLLNFMKPVVVPSFSDEFTLNHTPYLFEKYNETLNKFGLSLGYIDTMSDSALVFIHLLKDIDKIKNIFNILELQYIELKTSRKIELIKEEKKLPKNYIHIGKGVLGVKFFMSAKDVIEILGKPDNDNYSNTRENSFFMTYKKKGVEFSLGGRIARKDDELRSIFLYSGIAGGYDDGSFSKFSGKGKGGVSLDSTYDEIIEIFGIPNHISEFPFGKSPTKTVNYPGLSFTFTQEKSELIYIGLGI